jgi:N-acetylglucosaminyl-diphospho-decaprenol L-rhamnosyltransferase
MEQAPDSAIGPTPADTEIELSAIIVNYNDRRFLPAAIAALQENTVSDAAEIIVVDGGSTDGSADNLPSGDIPVSVIRCAENVGFCRGNNIGAEAARGRVVVFTQGDGELQPGWDVPLCQALRDPDVAVAGGLVLKMGSPEVIDSAGLAITTNLGAWSLDEWSTPEDVGIDGEEARDVVGVSPAFLAVRRADHLRIGGFWEKLFVYGDEQDYALRIRALGKAVLCPSSRMRHWGGGTVPVTSPLRLRLASRNRLLNAARHLSIPRLAWAVTITAGFDMLEVARQRNLKATRLMLSSWGAGLAGMAAARALSTRAERADTVQYLTPLRDYFEQRKTRQRAQIAYDAARLAAGSPQADR